MEFFKKSHDFNQLAQKAIQNIEYLDDKLYQHIKNMSPDEVDKFIMSLAEKKRSQSRSRINIIRSSINLGLCRATFFLARF